MKIKRFKIAEQILVVLSLALILPLIVAGAIIINTNQIAVRKELETSAKIIANSVKNEFISLRNYEKNNLYYTYNATKKMSSTESKEFMTLLLDSDANILELKEEKFPRKHIIPKKFSSVYFPENQTVVFAFVADDNVLVSKKVSINYIYNRIFDLFNPQGRQIYVFDRNKTLVMSQYADKQRLADIIEVFPKQEEIESNVHVLFAKHKNQPNILLYLEDFDWYIVVASPKDLTDYGIVEARRKIILSICCAAIVVFVLFGIYTFSLYTNIRQFFKAIAAISAGNYTRKLRFVMGPFTSQEAVFISAEFNKMLKKIDDSYKKLHESNKKLQKMDEYKSNLIDTVSHEFRTPLTSIKGYTSSLLRHDIQLDDETRKKSLKIIKQQAERLSRMVEDLLVIPDIESASLRMNLEEVNLKELLEISILSTSKADTASFNVDIPDIIPNIYADADRLVQVLINLLENAVKYSKESTPINISASSSEDFITLKVHNEAEYIDKKVVNALFEKFTRVDSNLTRTTRGTGLGLFIVKGLVEAMGGNIFLKADNGFEVIFTIPIYKGQDNIDA